MNGKGLQGTSQNLIEVTGMLSRHLHQATEYN